MVLAGAEPDDGAMAVVMADPKTMVLIITVIIIPNSHLGGPHFFFSTFLFRPSISTFIGTLMGLSCFAVGCSGTGWVAAVRVFLSRPDELFR